MAGLEAEPVWLDRRTLEAVLDACRRDHRAALVDVPERVVSRIVAAPRACHAQGERDPGRLGAAVFSAVWAESGLGPGRILLALVAALVFWEVNGFVVVARPGRLVDVARRAIRRREPHLAISALFREREGWPPDG